MLNTITTVLVGLLGVHALAKFVFFALPYRRRRAALDKSYGDKPSATTTSDTVMVLFTISCTSTSFTPRSRKTARPRRSFRRSSRCRTRFRIHPGGHGVNC